MIKKNLFVAMTAVLILLPTFAFAQTTPSNRNVWSPAILNGPLISCTGAGATGGTDNKNCTSFCDLVSTFENIIYFGIGIVIWIFTPIMVAISGVMLMMSRGNPERASSARKMITGTLIGLVIVVCAYLVLSIFISVLGLTGSIGGFGTATCSVS